MSVPDPCPSVWKWLHIQETTRWQFQSIFLQHGVDTYSSCIPRRQPLYLFFPLFLFHFCLTRLLSVTCVSPPEQCFNIKIMLLKLQITAEPSFMYSLCYSTFHMILQNPNFSPALCLTRHDHTYISHSQLWKKTALRDIIIRWQKSFPFHCSCVFST